MEIKKGDKMYIDPIAVQYPENLRDDHYVIATYYCATGRNTNALKFGAAMAVEQSCGTWLKVPGKTSLLQTSALWGHRSEKGQPGSRFVGSGIRPGMGRRRSVSRNTSIPAFF